MSQQPKGQCQYCTHFDGEPTQYGYCHRFPPVLMRHENVPRIGDYARPDHITTWGWPTVGPDGWCGEYEQ